MTDLLSLFCRVVLKVWIPLKMESMRFLTQMSDCLEYSNLGWLDNMGIYLNPQSCHHMLYGFVLSYLCVCTLPTRNLLVCQLIPKCPTSNSRQTVETVLVRYFKGKTVELLLYNINIALPCIYNYLII